MSEILASTFVISENIYAFVVSQQHSVSVNLSLFSAAV